METQPSRTLLVTGASGHLGRRVVELLLEARAGRIVATTRTPEKLSDLAARGAEVRRADFEDRASLGNAFAGAGRMLLISTDALDKPGRRLKEHLAAVEAAAQAGVQHIVYTSMPHPAESPIFFAADHKGTEEALQAGALSWTVLRNNWYADFLLFSLPAAVAKGQLFSSAGDGGAAYVTREDCARAAVAALVSGDTSRKVVNITGPAVMGFAELARIASEISGRSVSYVRLAPEALKEALLKAGMPALFAEIRLQSELAMAKGLMGPASGGVLELTGRKPASVSEFLGTQRSALLSQVEAASPR